MKVFAQYCLGFLALGLEVFTREAMNQSLWAPSFLLFFVLWMVHDRREQHSLYWVMSIFADGFSTSLLGPYDSIWYTLSLGDRSVPQTTQSCVRSCRFWRSGGTHLLSRHGNACHFSEADRQAPRCADSTSSGDRCFARTDSVSVFDRFTRVEQRNETMMSLGPRSQRSFHLISRTPNFESLRSRLAVDDASDRVRRLSLCGFIEFSTGQRSLVRWTARE